MNKRAFTLIELLAIMTLLGIMVVLVLPQISGSIESRKTSQYNNIINTVKSAAKVYYSENDQTSMVSVSTLIQNDYLSSGLKNPINDATINGCVLIEKDSSGYNVYTYYEDCNNLHEYTMTNLITNGSFESGTSNWDFSSSTSVSSNKKKYGNYSARNLNGAQYSGVSKGWLSGPANLITVIPGHLYYVSDWIYLVSAGTGYCYSDTTLIYNSTSNWFASIGSSGGVYNTWKKLSNRLTIPSVTTPKMTIATAGYSQTDNNIDCYSDGALLVDLTATFGAGNEPTKEWCDNNIDYFDGTRNVWK